MGEYEGATLRSSTTTPSCSKMRLKIWDQKRDRKWPWPQGQRSTWSLVTLFQPYGGVWKSQRWLSWKTKSHSVPFRNLRMPIWLFVFYGTERNQMKSSEAGRSGMVGGLRGLLPPPKTIFDLHTRRMTLRNRSKRAMTLKSRSMITFSSLIGLNDIHRFGYLDKRIQQKMHI